jgi:hypothetical protein
MDFYWPDALKGQRDRIVTARKLLPAGTLFQKTCDRKMIRAGLESPLLDQLEEMATHFPDVLVVCDRGSSSLTCSRLFLAAGEALS